ncbi:MAG: GGDEF domain-containing protein [Lawsonibacter sp.]
MHKVSISSMRKAGISILVAYILIYYTIIGIFSGVQISYLISDLLSLIGEGAGIIIIVFGIHWQVESSKTEWLMFSFGIGLNLIADLIWSICEILLRQKVPFPSICDIFYLCGSVCYLIALIHNIRQEKVLDVIRTGFDIAITMVASTTIIIEYIMLPIWNDQTLTFLQKIISLIYPIFDLGYLGGIISLLFFCSSKAKFNLSNLLISAAFLIWFFADLLYAILSSNSYVSGGLLDPLWPIGCWILALGALYPPYQRKESAEQRIINRRQSLRGYLRLLFPYLSGGMVIILVSYQYIFKDPLVAGAVITVLLIMVRQILTLVENKQLVFMIQNSNLLLEKSKVALEEQNIELQKLNHLKQHEANTDFLTSMFNRRYVYETLQSLSEQYEENEKMELCVLLIDIDHYKQINDHWGHEIGDVVLQQIAHLIKKNIRSTDIAGRFGGDEFIVILPNANLNSAKSVAEKLITMTNEKKFLVNNTFLKVTLSIGCVRWRGYLKEYNMQAIVAAADKALYKAKADGRNQYIIEEFEPDSFEFGGTISEN